MSGHVERVALIAKTAADARDVMVEGKSGVLAVGRMHGIEPVYEPSKRRVTWPNGATATIYTGEKPDQLRGPEHQIAWIDEFGAMVRPDGVLSNCSMGLRLSWANGRSACALVTTTPRPTKAMKELRKKPGIVIVYGKTSDNLDNLDAAAVADLTIQYAGTALGRQELDGELIEDVDGALWTIEMIDRGRIRDEDDATLPEWRKVIVSVDPSGSSKSSACETGIIVLALGTDDHVYVLADRSIRGTPKQWGSAAVEAAIEFGATEIIGEVNFGGEMVTNTIRQLNPPCPVKEITASKGKRIRAAPVSTLYALEDGEGNPAPRVHHVGVFGDLESQQITWTGATNEASPDRLDALVHGVAHLGVTPRKTFGIY